MTPRELAAAIRKGHTMIGEALTPYVGFVGGKPCGCALGAAYVASGFNVPSDDNIHEWMRMQTSDAIAEKLHIPFDLATDISVKHYRGMSRLAIADWLDTLEPETKPADKQSFDSFMATVMQPVAVTA